MITTLSSAYLTRGGGEANKFRRRKKEPGVVFVVGLTVVRDATVPSTVEKWKETWSCSNAMLMTRDEKKGGGRRLERKREREMAS